MKKRYEKQRYEISFHNLTKKISEHLQKIVFPTITIVMTQ
jgi:hypothetical protein